MTITQDDLRLLSLLRAHWCGEGERADASLAACPGRAAGRVASWSLARTSEALVRGARRPLVIGETLAPSADERRFLLATRALAAGRWGDAVETLRWLVRSDAAEALAERAAPAACSAYGYAAPRRRQAASA